MYFMDKEQNIFDIPMNLIMLTDPVLKIRNLSLEPHPSTCNPCSVMCPLPPCPFSSGNKQIVVTTLVTAYKPVTATTVPTWSYLMILSVIDDTELNN